MGAKVTVRHGEAVDKALRRLKKLLERERISVRSSPRNGTFRWLYETKEHFQKPSLLKRIKKVRRQKRARKGTPREKGAPPP